MTPFQAPAFIKLSTPHMRNETQEGSARFPNKKTRGKTKMRTCKGSEGQGKQPLELRLGRIRGTYSQAAYNAAFVCSSLAIILPNYSLFQRSCIIWTYTNVFFSSHMRVTSSRPARARVVERVIRHLKWLPYVLQPSQYITADRAMP